VPANGRAYIPCQNGCFKEACTKCFPVEDLLTCHKCNLVSCQTCASTQLSFNGPDGEAKTKLIYRCSKCQEAVCETCWLKHWNEKKEIIAQCARCKKLICDKCKPSFMHEYETVLPGCFNCSKCFCEDCVTQNTVVCRKRDCTCNPRCVCDVVCIDCREEKCRYVHAPPPGAHATCRDHCQENVAGFLFTHPVGRPHSRMLLRYTSSSLLLSFSLTQVYLLGNAGKLCRGKRRWP
jgi:hypothetical protein